MAEVTIGGDTIKVSLPNFKALKAAWSHISAVHATTDPMAGIDAILGVISVGKVGDPVTVDQLEEALKPSEMAGLRPFLNALMIESGLATAPGEAKPAGDLASPSTATSEASSISS